MRYGTSHKEESRTRILAAAAGQFRKKGVEAVRVADVMMAAGLTHGGFYKHFADKEQLFHQAIATCLNELADRISAMTAGKPRAEALEMVIGYYLSEDHMRHPDLGCALAALGTEMARLTGSMKREVNNALLNYAERLSYLMPGDDEEERKAAFLILFPSMAGCIMTARSLTSRSRQSQVLSRGRSFFTQVFADPDYSRGEQTDHRLGYR